MAYWSTTRPWSAAVVRKRVWTFLLITSAAVQITQHALCNTQHNSWLPHFLTSPRSHVLTSSIPCVLISSSRHHILKPSILLLLLLLLLFGLLMIMLLLLLFNVTNYSIHMHWQPLIWHPSYMIHSATEHAHKATMSQRTHSHPCQSIAASVT